MAKVLVEIKDIGSRDPLYSRKDEFLGKRGVIQLFTSLSNPFTEGRYWTWVVYVGEDNLFNAWYPKQRISFHSVKIERWFPRCKIVDPSRIEEIDDLAEFRGDLQNHHFTDESISFMISRLRYERIDIDGNWKIMAGMKGCSPIEYYSDAVLIENGVTYTTIDPAGFELISEGSSGEGYITDSLGFKTNKVNWAGGLDLLKDL